MYIYNYVISTQCISIFNPLKILSINKCRIFTITQILVIDFNPIINRHGLKSRLELTSTNTLIFVLFVNMLSTQKWLFCVWWVEDTKMLIRIRKSKKDGQQNGQKKMGKKTNNDLQYNTPKTKDRLTPNPLTRKGVRTPVPRTG